MYRVHTETNKFVTGRVRKSKQKTIQTVLGDSQITNIIPNDLQYTNTRPRETNIFQQNSKESENDFISSVRSNISESLENTEWDKLSSEAEEEANNDDDNYISFLEDNHGPYFPNITVFLIFIWTVKHMIGNIWFMRYVLHSLHSLFTD